MQETHVTKFLWNGDQSYGDPSLDRLGAEISRPGVSERAGLGRFEWKVKLRKVMSSGDRSAEPGPCASG